MDSLSFSELSVIEAHDNKIQSLSFNFHQTFLLSASADQTAKMWDLETWECVKTRARRAEDGAAAPPRPRRGSSEATAGRERSPSRRAGRRPRSEMTRPKTSFPK